MGWGRDLRLVYWSTGHQIDLDLDRDLSTRLDDMRLHRPPSLALLVSSWLASPTDLLPPPHTPTPTFNLQHVGGSSNHNALQVNDISQFSNEFVNAHEQFEIFFTISGGSKSFWNYLVWLIQYKCTSSNNVGYIGNVLFSYVANVLRQ